MPDPTLTKTRYLAGCQCTRRLWLATYGSELATPPDASQRALLDAGTAIGLHARGLFPGGRVAYDESRPYEESVRATQTMLADPAIPAIFEAAFLHDGVRVRVDVLERLGDAWGIREVKSGTRVRDVHLQDVALQREVLERAGLRIASVEVIHVDTSFVRDGGNWPAGFFERVDVLEAIEPLRAAVAGRIAALQAVLASPDSPAIEPSEHCFTPHRCEFWAHCARNQPRDWIIHLPGRRPGPFEALRALGVTRIPDIPDDFPLTLVQARMRDVLRSGHEFIASELGEALAASGPPAYYLDFETVNPAIPLYDGEHPYQQVPFQWSLHKVDADGGLTHWEFLARGPGDPRRAFAESLLAAVGTGSEPIVVYSSFEGDVLADLAAAVPDMADAIEAVRARLVDLLPVVREHVYHPGFDGSFSLKRVAPALVEGFGYGDLDGVADGASASLALVRLASGELTHAEEERLRAALLDYCGRDTLALVEVHRALRARAGLS